MTQRNEQPLTQGDFSKNAEFPWICAAGGRFQRWCFAFIWYILPSISFRKASMSPRWKKLTP